MIANFPEFTPLDSYNRGEYDKIAANYPPYSNTSYPSMYIWNTHDDQLSAARHGDNLVLNYSMPYDTDNSGLSVLGQSDVDASMDTVLDHLQGSGQQPRILHIPEVVINNIYDLDKYEIEANHITMNTCSIRISSQP